MSRPRPRYSWPAGAKARLQAASDHAAALTLSYFALTNTGHG